MKNIILSALILCASTVVSSAGNLYARVVQVEPKYESVVEYTPIKICRDEQIPIYGQAQQNTDNSGNVLLGMILGGVSGKVITGDDGGAAMGAIAGGLIGSNQNNNNSQRPIVGYQTVQNCSTENRQTSSTQIKNYKITYDFHGALGTSYSYNNYNIGDNIPVTVNVIAQ